MKNVGYTMFQREMCFHYGTEANDSRFFLCEDGIHLFQNKTKSILIDQFEIDNCVVCCVFVPSNFKVCTDECDEDETT